MFAGLRKRETRPYSSLQIITIEADMFILAYIDPGTGSFFIQLVTGGIFGVLFVVRRSWHRAKSLLDKKK
jgi:hypothetical protein